MQLCDAGPPGTSAERCSGLLVLLLEAGGRRTRAVADVPVLPTLIVGEGHDDHADPDDESRQREVGERHGHHVELGEGLTHVLGALEEAPLPPATDDGEEGAQQSAGRHGPGTAITHVCHVQPPAQLCTSCAGGPRNGTKDRKKNQGLWVATLRKGAYTGGVRLCGKSCRPKSSDVRKRRTFLEEYLMQVHLLVPPRVDYETLALRRRLRERRRELLRRHRCPDRDKNPTDPERRSLMLVRMPGTVASHVGRTIQRDKGVFHRIHREDDRGEKIYFYWFWVRCETTARGIFSEFEVTVIARRRCANRPRGKKLKKARRWAVKSCKKAA